MNTPSIEPNTVHVWHLELDLEAEALSQVADLLDEEEQLTAAYFREARHRDRFIAGRGQLRQLLGAYASIEPANLQFTRSENGKPALVDYGSCDELFFNFTHSGERAVCAVTHIGPVGVDLERVQAWDDLRELEELVFTRDEIALLEVLAEDERDVEFFRLWTHKEALVKATGDGLSLAPETFAVDLVEACLLCGDLSDAGWRFSDVSQSREWPAAIAIASDDYAVRQFSNI